MRAGRALAGLAVLLGACSGLPVHISTPKPIEVNVSMRVDIFQRAAQSGDATGDQPAEPEGTSKSAIESRRRDRMAEIQRCKNSRIVGENHYGLLSIREPPPGPYGERVKQVVEAENADRSALMKSIAAEHRVALSRVEADQAELWRERAFPGEWIELQQPDGTWQWVPKRAEQAPDAAPTLPPGR
jgi:hypothetical protein